MSTVKTRDDDELWTPGHVARLFAVTPKTISRWDEAGILPAVRTPGGHRRFRAGQVRELIAALKEVGAR